LLPTSVDLLLHSLSQVCRLANIAEFSVTLSAGATFAGSHPGFATLPATQAAFAEFAPTLAGTHSGFAAFANILPAFAEFALSLTD